VAYFLNASHDQKNGISQRQLYVLKKSEQTDQIRSQMPRRGPSKRQNVLEQSTMKDLEQIRSRSRSNSLPGILRQTQGSHFFQPYFLHSLPGILRQTQGSYFRLSLLSIQVLWRSR